MNIKRPNAPATTKPSTQRLGQQQQQPQNVASKSKTMLQTPPSQHRMPTTTPSTTAAQFTTVVSLKTPTGTAHKLRQLWNQTVANEVAHAAPPAWLDGGYTPGYQIRTPRTNIPVYAWVRKLDEYYDVAIRHKDDTEMAVIHGDMIEEGAMVTCPTSFSNVLLVREAGQIYCCAALCPKHLAPLVKGYYYHYKVRCPWYGCGFDVRTGEPLDASPNLTTLRTFKLRLDEKTGMVNVKPPSFGPNMTVVASLQSMALISKPAIIAILGGGMSAVVAAATLRTHGFNGQIVILEQGTLPPYDRGGGVSRDLSNFDVAQCLLKPLDWYCRKNITLQLQAEVASVNFDSKQIQLKSMSVISYDRLIICTGCRPKKMLRRRNVLENDISQPLEQISGHSLRNIFHLHSAHDAASLRGACTRKRVVVVGSGLTAFEFVTWLADRPAFLGLVCNTSTPLESLMGKGITLTLQTELKRRMHKITCYFLHDVVRFETATPDDVSKMPKDQQTLAKDRVAYVVLRKYQRIKQPIVKKPAEDKKATENGSESTPASNAPDFSNVFVDDENDDEDDDEQQTVLRYEGDEIRIACDIVVVAIGVHPNTNFVMGSDPNKVDGQVILNKRGYIMTDQYMRTNLANVYACGDCSAPLAHNLGGLQLLASSTNYTFAGATARTAALNAGASVVASAQASSTKAAAEEDHPVSELQACSLFSTSIFGHEFHFAGDLQDDAPDRDAEDDEHHHHHPELTTTESTKQPPSTNEATKDAVAEKFRTIVHGALELHSFAMYYFLQTKNRRGGRCVGVLTENFPPAHVVYLELRQNAFNVYYEQLRAGSLVNPNLPKLGRSYLCNSLLESFFAQNNAMDGYGIIIPQDLLILAGAKSNKVRLLLQQQAMRRYDDSQQNLTTAAKNNVVERFKKKKTTGLNNFMPINATLTKILEQNESYSLK